MTTDDIERPRTSRITRRAITKLGRRGFVRSLVAVGVSVATANQVSVKDVKAAAGSGQVPIATTIESDETAMVPADWYDEFRHAIKVNKKRNFIDRHEDILEQGVIPGDRGGDVSHIIVTVREGSEEARGHVPEESDGVPVRIGTADEETAKKAGKHACPNQAEYNAERYRPECPGGVAVTTDDDDDNGLCFTATVGPLAKHKSDSLSDPGMTMTSAHLFANTDSECGNAEGDRGYQPAEEWEGGSASYRVKIDDAELDIAVLEPNPEFNLQPVSRVSMPEQVSYTRTRDFDLSGSFTKDAIADRKANGYLAHCVGVSGGYTSGDIQAIDKTSDFSPFPWQDATCNDKIPHQVTWGTGQTEGGDSGGPVFARNYSDATEEYNVICTHLGTNAWGRNSGTAVFATYNKSGWYYPAQ